jgi:hypothetical protein
MLISGRFVERYKHHSAGAWHSFYNRLAAGCLAARSIGLPERMAALKPHLASPSLPPSLLLFCRINFMHKRRQGLRMPMLSMSVNSGPASCELEDKQRTSGRY